MCLLFKLEQPLSLRYKLSNQGMLGPDRLGILSVGDYVNYLDSADTLLLEIWLRL